MLREKEEEDLHICTDVLWFSKVLGLLEQTYWSFISA
jgi:hypothetical protein